MSSPIEIYLQQIEAALKQGDSTEHTHRPFLKTLVESLKDKITATNEPKRRGGNAPDYVVLEDKVPIGFIEAKDVGKPLGAISETPQLKRYRESLNNLILTNYLDFVWFEHGEYRCSIKIATASDDGTINRGLFDAGEHLQGLFTQFFESEVPSVTTAEDLAERMASRARRLEESVEGVLANNESPSLRGLIADFKKELLPDLDDAKFADLYTQTVAYGLFTARVFTNHPPFNRQTAFSNLPKTNPFLKKMFQQIAGFDLDDEPFVWAVDNIAALLNRADMSGIMEYFVRGRRKGDPVVHFYETFLKAYDPKLRELRGVYYTPTPVVSYITRSVDAILKRDFGLSDGIADRSKLADKSSHKVLILDPATGTGTFLSQVIDLIYERYKREPAVWKGYVKSDLLPRLFGFEFLVAPYSIAHLKLGLQLADTGYEFVDNERLNIFLTNTLEEVQRLAEKDAAGMGYWIHEEASNAQTVKQDAPVMVILGNPPYSGHSANEGKWMRNLLRGIETKGKDNVKTESYFEVDGKPLDEKNPKWLNNDYVKFIRFSQWRIEQTGYGILAFITSNSYLDSPTFRGMRESLMKTFDDIYILDLHGNSKKKERSPDGSPDQNVFDITEGVSIGIFVKKPVGSNPTEDTGTKVYHHDLFGMREVFDRSDGEKTLIGGKYKYLNENNIAATNWIELSDVTRSTCLGSMYFFSPKGFDNIDEYCEGWNIAEVMSTHVLGFQTHRDHFAIDFDEGILRKRINDLEVGEISDEDLILRYGLENLDIKAARKNLREDTKKEEKFTNCLVAPFDRRSCFYGTPIMDRPRRELLNNVIGKDNLCLNIVRQTKADDWRHAVVSNVPTPAVYVEMKDGSTVFPLYLYPSEKEKATSMFVRLPNFTDGFMRDVSSRTRLDFVIDGKGDLKKNVGPEDIFAYAYSIFHATDYRTRYEEFLKIDFPRLPLTSNVKLFCTLVSLGDQLVKTHLLERDLPEICIYPADGNSFVEAISFDETSRDKGRVWINSKQYFDDVPTQVWNFHIGGYQVCHKWLKDRKGRTLNFEDLIHYKKIIAALSETIRLMSEIDETIAQHNGFPLR